MGEITERVITKLNFPSSWTVKTFERYQEQVVHWTTAKFQSYQLILFFENGYCILWNPSDWKSRGQSNCEIMYSFGNYSLNVKE